MLYHLLFPCYSVLFPVIPPGSGSTAWPSCEPKRGWGAISRTYRLAEMADQPPGVRADKPLKRFIARPTKHFAAERINRFAEERSNTPVA